MILKIQKPIPEDAVRAISHFELDKYGVRQFEIFILEEDAITYIHPESFDFSDVYGKCILVQRKDYTPVIAWFEFEKNKRSFEAEAARQMSPLWWFSENEESLDETFFGSTMCNMENALPTISYTGVVLDEPSRSALISLVGCIIPQEWKVICHHMTINMGAIDQTLNPDLVIGREVELYATACAISDLVLAVHVDTSLRTINQFPHVTVACNYDAGGKPRDSNDLAEWLSLDTPLRLTGVVHEVAFHKPVTA